MPLPNQQGSQQSQRSGGAQKPQQQQPFDPMRSVLEMPLQVLGQIISGQMVQASQQGVPYTSLLSDLMKITPQGAAQMGMQAGQAAGAQMGGAMAQGAKQGAQQAAYAAEPQGQSINTAAQTPQMNPGQLQNSPYQQGQPGFAPAQPGSINQAFTGGMQQNSMTAPQTVQGAEPYQPVGPTLLGGLIHMTPRDQLLLQQSAAGQQEMRGLKPMQAGEREKAQYELQGELVKGQNQFALAGYNQDRQDKRAQMKIDAAGKKNNSIYNQETFMADLGSIVQARDKLYAKGGLMGTMGLMGKAGAGMNIGSEQMANFDSLTNSFLYSAAAIIANQEGREVQEKDIKRMEKVAGFSANDTDERFAGKVNAVLTLMRNKGLKVPGNGREFISMARKGKIQPPKAQPAGKIDLGDGMTLEEID